MDMGIFAAVLSLACWAGLGLWTWRSQKSMEELQNASYEHARMLEALEKRLDALQAVNDEHFRILGGEGRDLGRRIDAVSKRLDGLALWTGVGKRPSSMNGRW